MKSTTLIIESAKTRLEMSASDSEVKSAKELLQKILDNIKREKEGHQRKMKGVNERKTKELLNKNHQKLIEGLEKKGRPTTRTNK